MRLSPILRSVASSSGRALAFWCPGCDSTHVVYVERTIPGPCWGYNEDVSKPTFDPSILITHGHYVSGQSLASDCYMCKRNAEKRAAGEEVFFECGVCHSYVREGRIEFLSDCTHHLAGQTVDLPEWHQPYGGTEE